MTHAAAPAAGAAARTEAALALARTVVLLFAASSLLYQPLQVPAAVPLLEVGVAALSAGLALWLWRRTPDGARVARVATAVDLGLVVAYSAAVSGRPASGALYLAFVCCSGPVRWGLKGVLVTGLPVGLAATAWPVQDAGGIAQTGVVMWLLIALLTVPTALVSRAWRRSGGRLADAQDRLLHQARHDDLTGLPNRAALLEALREAVPTSGTGGSGGLAVLFLDLDGFKAVNDELGHAVGDRLLVHVADCLQASLRPGDLVARFGGDEFVVLCHGVADADAGLALGDRVLAALQVPVALEAGPHFVPGGSAGVAVSGPGSTAEQLLHDADAAMYAAKAAGGRRARVAAASGDVEVAVREEQGPARQGEPDDPLDAPGRALLERALAEAAGWQGQPPPAVAVDLALRSLLDPRLPAAVAAALRRHGVPPSRLVLQLTGAELLHDPDVVGPALQALRALGVRLAVDGPGAGHASLACLAALPVDVLRVDGSLVARVADGDAWLAEGEATVVPLPRVPGEITRPPVS